MRVVFLLFLIGVSFPLSAQFPEPPPLERFLVPVFPYDLDGRFGSIWRSELVVSNPTGRDVLLSPGGPHCLVTGCGGPFVVIAPGVRTYTGGVNNGEPVVGGVWIVESEFADKLDYSLRVWDQSRMSEDWGTSVPVVKERDFQSGVVTLSGAPTGPGFRVTLRVYEPLTPSNAQSVRVTVFPIGGAMSPIPDATEGQTTILPLRGGTPPEWESDYPSIPSYGEINDLVAAFPSLMAAERFAVRIEPLNPALRYWAMLSVTHNETQRVTIIAPE